MTRSASLVVICGCMFSGKTTELIRRLREAQSRGERALGVAPLRDTRSAGRLRAHTGEEMAAVVAGDGAEIIGLARAHGAGVVGVDEAHFFADAAADAVAALLRDGVRVVVAGVDTDHRGEAFAPFPALLALADEVVRLTAACAVCGAPATRTQRMAASGERIVVGGAGMYEPRCLGCFVPA